MSKWIMFDKCVRPANRKTDTYIVVTIDYRQSLGQIAWYAQWRKYAFYPNANTVYETQCLSDIIEFINQLMAERKLSKHLNQKI